MPWQLKVAAVEIDEGEPITWPPRREHRHRVGGPHERVRQGDELSDQAKGSNGVGERLVGDASELKSVTRN